MSRPRNFLLLLALTVAQLSAQSAPAPKFRIGGKAVDAVTGQPLAGTEITIGKAEQADALPQRMLTADDGSFGFVVNDPGKYVLAGQRTGFRRQGYEQHGMYLSAVVVGHGVNSENIVFRLRPDARIVGSIVEDDHEPVQGAFVYLFRADASGGLRQTFLADQAISDDRGRYLLSHLEPGWYYVVVSAQPWFGYLAQSQPDAATGLPANAALDLVYPTTFYPGVSDPASASQIVLNDGEEFAADFTLTAIPSLHLRLNHLNPDPTRPQRGANLKQKVFGAVLNPISTRQNVIGDALEIGGLPPADYVLDIQSYTTPDANRSIPVNLTADLELDADSASSTRPISGSIKMDAGSNLQPQAYVRLWNSHTGQVFDAQISPAGQFDFDDDFVAPGNYFVFLMNGLIPTPGEISATGARVAGQTIQIADSGPVKLQIALPHNLSIINGTAMREGKPFAGAMILLVPENPEINLPLFRRDQSDSDGTFTLRDVLPGRYRILAIEDGWDLEWANPALLKPRLLRAQSVNVQPDKTYQAVINAE